MPRISANKLGEYLVASPARRKTIVKDQKFPQAIKVAPYRLAAEPVEEFFLSGGKNTAAIDAAVVRLRSQASGSTWSRDDRENTAAALDKLLKMRDRLFPSGITYVAGPSNAEKLTIAGVDISVRPTLLALDERRKRIGAVKIHYIKAAESALAGKGAEYVATLSHQWLLKCPPRSGYTPAPSLTLSIDVFRESVVAAPANQARRMADVTVACEEIAAWWGTITS